MANSFVSTCVFLPNRGGGLGDLPYHYQPCPSFACICLCLRLFVCPREGARAQLMYVQSSPSFPRVCVLLSPKEGCCHISQDHPLLKQQVAAIWNKSQGRWVCKNGQSIHFFVFVFGPKKGGLGRHKAHSFVFLFVVRCKEKGSTMTESQRKVEGLWNIG